MSTYIGLHYHVIFSTKNREPWLAPENRRRVHEYLGGLVDRLDGEIHGVGGTGDHVNLLVSLRAMHSLADFMRELKKGSSAWTKETLRLPGFSWQDGYCALTMSPSGRASVHRYIASQDEHHRAASFLDELRSLLQKAAIPFDEKYLA